MRTAQQIWAEFQKKKRSLCERRHRWVVDTEMGLHEMWYEGMTGLNSLITELTADFCKNPTECLGFIKRGAFLYQLS